MANVVVVLFGVLVVATVIRTMQRHRVGLVSERGTSIGAHLGTLANQPRVRIGEVTATGADRARIVLIRDAGPDQDLVVSFTDREFGRS